MILSCSPYRNDKNLGRAYNEAMALLGPDDWAAFIDHDAMHCTPDWHRLIDTAIAENPEYQLFVGSTNRIGCGWMKAHGVDPNNFDLRYHRRIGKELAEKWGSTVDDVTEWEGLPSGKPLSGVLMVLSKRAWASINGCKNGFLTVDNHLHKQIRDAGYKVGYMKGVYLVHWYRASL